MIFNFFETERLLLKPMSLEDAAFILELYNSPNFIKYIGDRNLKTIVDAENYIREKFLPHFEKLGFGNYLIIEKQTHKKIGAVGVFVRDGLEIPDIGFSFLPDFEGKGFGFESANFLKNLAFQKFGLHKISAITSKDNISSQKLIEKLGLKFQKTVQLPNEDEELLYYEIQKI